MSCYLHTNAESTSQCESCGVDLCDDCSTRFEELKCANCMKKAIMARRIRYAIGWVVAIIIWFYVSPKNFNSQNVESVYRMFFAFMLAFFAFSLSHGLEDFYKAIRNPWYQLMQQISIKGYKNGMMSAKGEQFLMAILGMMFSILFFGAIYIGVFVVWVGFYSLSSIVRKTIQIVKEFKVDTSI